MPEKWFDQFDLVICDEVHLAKAASITSIMCKLTKCKHRFGFTGTLDGTPTNKIVIQGLFGPIINVTTTARLIDSNVLSNFSVKCIVLSYPDSVRQLVKNYRYPNELEYIVTNQARNKLISKLACSVNGNTLVLFQFVEKHGNPLQQLIRNNTDRPVYYIHGAVEGQQRESIRQLIEQQDNAIIVASVQTFSTGINIKSLKNIIFASPSKSRIRTLQSIGRVLRKADNKDQANLYDIADDLKWKSKTNFTLAHFFERLKLYNQEQFPYTVHKMELKIDV
jgi:superfamily II DNA or RNA helicase